MDQQRVDLYLTTNSAYFPEYKILVLREFLLDLPPEREATLNSLEFRSPMTMFVVSLCWGGLGVDRFIFGDTGMGILKLLTGGCCGVLTIIDAIDIIRRTKEYNYDKLMAMLRYSSYMASAHVQKYPSADRGAATGYGDTAAYTGPGVYGDTTAYPDPDLYGDPADCPDVSDYNNPDIYGEPTAFPDVSDYNAPSSYDDL